MKRSSSDSMCDAGCCTGMPEGTTVGQDGVSEAALRRGFIKPGLPTNDSNRERLSDAPWDMGGALSRPEGWER